MKKLTSIPTRKLVLLFTLLNLAFHFHVNAQSTILNDLPQFVVTKNTTLHFVSPEPIQYVDISTNQFVGDIPVENILRVKYFPDTAEKDSDFFSASNLEVQQAVVTITGQSFYAQYQLVYVEHYEMSAGVTSIEIQQDHMRPLDFPSISMTKFEMEHYAMEVTKRKRSFFNVAAKESGMTAYLNNIFAFGDYIFLDVGFRNHTNIRYDVDEFRFNIKDKRIVKATNAQDIEIIPEFTLYEQPYFRKNFRNVFVFKKMTFPNDKVLSIQMTEDQISGRTIELKIDYRDLLNADTL